MRQILLVLALLLFGFGAANATQAGRPSNATTQASVSASSSASKAIEPVQASNGEETRNFTVFGAKQPSGKWFFYIPYNGVNYGVRWSSQHRKFYVYIDYTNWYFWSKTLDYYAGQNENGY
ncbi:MAG: hypothetical protein K2F77_00175 [Muribaculaceae bacterium]|nr:hypothetical protein [Muribaculaceae bacterium]